MRNATIGTLSVAIAFVLGLPGLSTIAIAQEAEELEEIFVTARKRTESLEEIPVAVSAFGSDELFKRGARNLIDVAKFTPGFQFNEQGVQEPGRLYTSLRFRGLGSEIKEPFGQVGSAFLDGVYMSSGVSSLGNENLERVEIIKGPAASWLGRSTFAGAINLITKTPSLEEYSGRVTADYRQDQTYDLSFAHEGPIIRDKLAYRIFVRGYGTDGQYSNSNGDPLGEETTDTIMGTLYAEPTDGLSVRFRALWSKDEDGLPAQLFITGPQGLRGQNTGALTNCLEKNPEFQTTFRRNDPAQGLLTDFVCGEIPKALDLVAGNTRLEPDFFRFWEEVVPQIGGIPSLGWLFRRHDVEPADRQRRRGRDQHPGFRLHGCGQLAITGSAGHRDRAIRVPHHVWPRAAVYLDARLQLFRGRFQQPVLGWRGCCGDGCGHHFHWFCFLRPGFRAGPTGRRNLSLRISAFRFPAANFR
jgi:hypothetical protein